MNGAPSKVSDFFGMAQCEHPVRSFVAGVGRRCRVAFAKGSWHLREALNTAGPTAVAHHLELAVPVFGWKPKLHLDFGVSGRLQGCRNPAMRGQYQWSGLRTAPCGGSGWSAAAALGRLRAGRHELDSREDGIGGLEGLQFFTSGGIEGRGRRHAAKGEQER